MFTDITIFEKELGTDDDDTNDRWKMDLTMTSLIGILSSFYSQYKTEMTVICDNSKSFVENPNFDMIQNMGRNGKVGVVLGASAGFKLAKDITLSDSKDSLGIQVADLFSSTVFFCLKNQKLDFSKRILKLVLDNSICKPATYCVMPETRLGLDLEYDENYYMEFMALILAKAKK